MYLIDLENHFYDRFVIETFARRDNPPYYRRGTDRITWSEQVSMPQGKLLEALLETGEGRIAKMDRLGISCAVISSAPGVENLSAEEAIAACRVENDALYALTKEFPGRYLGSAILPVQDVRAAETELRRCVSELGFVAWHTHSNYGAASPDDKRYQPLFKTAAELGVYVYLHPQLPAASRVDDLGFTVAGPGLGFTIDTMTTLTRMIVTGLFDDVPQLKMVVGHLGEALPFLLDRMTNRIKFLPNPAVKNKFDFDYYFHNNIWVTTSGNMSKAAFACTSSALGADRIIFGSDYPFEDAADMVGFIEELPLSRTDRERLYYKNAESLGAIYNA